MGFVAVTTGFFALGAYLDGPLAGLGIACIRELRCCSLNYRRPALRAACDALPVRLRHLIGLAPRRRSPPAGRTPNGVAGGGRCSLHRRLRGTGYATRRDLSSARASASCAARADRPVGSCDLREHPEQLPHLRDRRPGELRRVHDVRLPAAAKTTDIRAAPLLAASIFLTCSTSSCSCCRSSTALTRCRAPRGTFVSALTVRGPSLNSASD